MKHRYLKIAVLPLVVIVLVVFGLGYWRFVTIGQNQKLINEAKIVKAVGNLVVLPIGETPVIAEVNDVGQLKDQLFFRQTKNGDKLLIFVKAKIAILYNPDIKKIINYGPLNVDEQKKQAQVVLLNGSSVYDLTKIAEAELQASFPGINIIQKESADGKYLNTLIVALTPDAKVSADLLSKHYKAELVGLPDGEKIPNSGDILVILGEDLAALLKK